MRKPTPIKPMGVSVNRQPWWHTLLVVAGSLLIAAILFVLLLEWAAGCGESFVDSKGVTHVNECVFINRGESK